MDAVRGFAGAGYGRAIVEEAARAALGRRDQRVAAAAATVDTCRSARSARTLSEAATHQPTAQNGDSECA